jgi:uncharacterized membrane protein
MAVPRSAALLGAFFIIAGIGHFMIPTVYVGIMPPWAPRPLLLVYVSGACEILGGIGVLVKPLRQMAGLGLIALLVAVFPANVQMAMHARDVHASWLMFVGLAFIRLPIQSLFIVWIWRVMHPTKPTQSLGWESASLRGYRDIRSGNEGSM